MMQMGLFQSLVNWQANRFENHRANMESLGKCPECRGRGVISGGWDYEYAIPANCPACNGSGQYAEWEKNEE